MTHATFPEALGRIGPTTGTGHPEIDRRTLERTRLVVAEIDADPSLLEVDAKNLRRWMAMSNGAPKRAHVEWAGLIADTPWPVLRELMLEESDEGQRLRSSIPFAGVLTEQERLSVR